MVSFREVICLVPCCSQSVQLTKILEHFENVHFMTPNANSNIEYNVSEIIMQRKCIGTVKQRFYTFT